MWLQPFLSECSKLVFVVLDPVLKLDDLGLTVLRFSCSAMDVHFLCFRLTVTNAAVTIKSQFSRLCTKWCIERIGLIW